MSARGGSRAEACPGGHIGPPLRDGGAFRTNGNWRETAPFPAGRDGARPLQGSGAKRVRRGVVTPPYGCNTGSAQLVRSNGPMWASAPTPCGGRHAGVVVPYGWLRRAAAIALGSGAQRGVCGAGAKKWAGIAAEIIPKVSSNAGQSLSRPAGDSSLCTREPLGTGIRIAASLRSSQ